MIVIDVTSNVEVGEVRYVGPMSVAPSFKLLILFLQWWKWAKMGSYGESSFNGELWFHEQFWQRQDTCDCGSCGSCEDLVDVMDIPDILRIS